MIGRALLGDLMQVPAGLDDGLRSAADAERSGEEGEEEITLHSEVDDISAPTPST
jgi:hypothetical protein